VLQVVAATLKVDEEMNGVSSKVINNEDPADSDSDEQTYRGASQQAYPLVELDEEDTPMEVHQESVSELKNDVELNEGSDYDINEDLPAS
jgi:hypothetical protein